MDKFVKRFTDRRATKRNYTADEHEDRKKHDKEEKVKDAKSNGSTWKRCDSLTEAEHKNKTGASPKKRQKLEHQVSPIKFLNTIEEYPPLNYIRDENSRKITAVKDKSKLTSSKPALNNNTSLNDLLFFQNDLVTSLISSGQYSDISWAEEVEEEERRKTSQVENKTGLNDSSNNQIANKIVETVKTVNSPPRAPPGAKDSKRRKGGKIKFEESIKLTQIVGESLKFDDYGNKHESSWTHRLRSPAKNNQPKNDEYKNSRSHYREEGMGDRSTSKQRATPKRLLNTDGKRSTPKSPQRRTPKKSGSAAGNTWRKKTLLDEDSQNTLTEVAQITRSVVLKPKDDDNTQSCFDGTRPKRSAGPPVRFPLPENWVEPKNGWERDQAVLERRDKDISKGYNSDVYKKYIQIVPKKDRIKHVHPRTPNKHLKVPRRSWDAQVRVWRRMLYAAVDMELPSDASFISSVNGSDTNSIASDQDAQDMKIYLMDVNTDVTMAGQNENDEETIKAGSNQDEIVRGPIDFTILST